MKQVWRRVAWTLGAVAVIALGSQISLPGVDVVELHSLLHAAGHRAGATAAVSQFSVLALGITPLVSAFVLVEVAALIVPRWRPLRHGGPASRDALGRAVAVLAVVIAAVQAVFVARYLEALSFTSFAVYSGGRDTFWAVVFSLVAGTLVLAWLISVIGKRGLGNGYAVLLLIACVTGVHYQDLAPTPLAGALAIGAALLVIGAAAVLLAARPRRIPFPASGLEPLGDARAFAALFATLAAFGIWTPWFGRIGAFMARPRVAAVAVAAFALLWAHVFARPRLSRATRGEWWAAALLGMAVLVGMDVVAAVARSTVPDARSLLDPWTLVMATAIALDLYDEFRARRSALVPVWPLHAPLRIADVRDRLAAEGIEHHLQSRRLRTLLWFFGPYVPIVVLVPPDRAADAERVLGELLTAVR